MARHGLWMAALAAKQQTQQPKKQAMAQAVYARGKGPVRDPAREASNAEKEYGRKGGAA